MGFEKFSGNKRAINQDHLGLGDIVTHFDHAPGSTDIHPAIMERILHAHDRVTQAALTSALERMLNQIGVPESALDELDQTQYDAINSVVRRYLEAEKISDLPAKKRCTDELATILG